MCSLHSYNNHNKQYLQRSQECIIYLSSVRLNWVWIELPGRPTSLKNKQNIFLLRLWKLFGGSKARVQYAVRSLPIVDAIGVAKKPRDFVLNRLLSNIVLVYAVCEINFLNYDTFFWHLDFVFIWFFLNKMTGN